MRWSWRGVRLRIYPGLRPAVRAGTLGQPHLGYPRLGQPRLGRPFSRLRSHWRAAGHRPAASTSKTAPKPSSGISRRSSNSRSLPRQPEPTDHVICPDIIILDGTADDRVYGSGDQSNSNLRYQFSLNDVARDCKIDGDKISLKIGAAGKVLLGPVGSPGTFTAPIRIAIVRQADQDPVASQLFQVPVTIASGQSEAPFTLVTDQMSVPYSHTNAQHDYMIKIGFDAGGKSQTPARGHPRAHRQSTAPAAN